MECLVERCAGLDIGKADLKACVRVPGARGGRRAETRTFATTTGALLGCQVPGFVETGFSRVDGSSCADLGWRGGWAFLRV